MAGDSDFNSVSLLLKFNGVDGSETFTDASNKNKSVSVGSGSPTLSTAKSKWGGSSLLISGTSGSEDLIIPNDDDFKFGSNNFTVEGWFLPAVSGNGRIFYNVGVNATDGLALGVSLSHVFFRRFGTGDFSADVSLSTTEFTHVAFQNNNGVQQIFVNGVLVASSALAINISNTDTIHLGANPVWSLDSSRYYGYIDDLRITKGVARYTGAFSVPSSAFPDYHNQKTGNIIESLAISDWRITAYRCRDGAFAGTAIASGPSYTIGLNTDEPVNLTLAPKIDYQWSAGKATALGDYVVAVDPDATPHLWKCNTAGTTGGSEPSWNMSGITSDGTCEWTYVAPLVDPVTLGPKIPV